MSNTARVDVKGNGAKLKAALRKIAECGKVSLDVGFFEDAKYPDGTSVAYVAYLNEYGGHNPARPFMKQTAKKRMKSWAEGVGKNVKKTGVTPASVKRAFEMAGQVAVGDVKRTIKDWPPGGNKDSTVAAKRRRMRGGTYDEPKGNLVAIKPETVLIDTGKMISSVAYEVKTNGRT